MEAFTNFYNYTPTELSGGLILFNLFISFALQMIIVFVYKKTRHGLSYSQSFIFTLIIVGVLGTSIMMAVQNNIVGALAIFGAFTLIRFRSILKETSDLAYIFFSLVLGISVGMSHYSLALLTAVFLSLVIYLFHRFGFGTISDNFDYLLIISANNNFEAKILHDALFAHISHQELLHVKHYTENNSEYAYSLRFKKNIDPTIVSEQIKVLAGVEKMEFLTGKNTSEF